MLQRYQGTSNLSKAIVNKLNRPRHYGCGGAGGVPAGVGGVGGYPCCAGVQLKIAEIKNKARMIFFITNDF